MVLHVVRGARCRRWLGLLFGVLVSCCCATASAESLFGVVSERTAALVLEAAEPLVANHRIVLRTPEQIATLTDEQLSAQLRDADAVLLANVFGEQATRLARLLQSGRTRQHVPVLAVSGAPELTRQSRFAGDAPLEELSEAALRELSSALSTSDPEARPWRSYLTSHPRQAAWIEGSAYWRARSRANVHGLLRWLLGRAGADITVPAPEPTEAVRFLQNGSPTNAGSFAPGTSVVALLDYEEGAGEASLALHGALCAAITRQGMGCLSVLARWGHATAQALEILRERVAPARLGALVVIQDFVLGSSEARERASRALSKLDVPTFKAVRLVDRTETVWRLSSDGLPWDTVHYRLAMPELQGIGQPTVIEAAGPVEIHRATGLALRRARPLETEIDALAARLARFQVLASKPNAEKRVAIIYYNHPPGRHNIGADNLDVPASLLEILKGLRAAGYQVGEVPRSSEELVARLQRDGVNLPEDRAGLAEMASRIASVSGAEYTRYFDGLPEAARVSVAQGPLARLLLDVERARAAAEFPRARERVENCLKDIRHVLEGSAHRTRARALALLDQLAASYKAYLAPSPAEATPDAQRHEELKQLTESLIATGIEGLTGWGEAPGRGMVHEGRLLVPGIQLGNVFLGPQPPRGWELDEELLHANLSFPPPHQYLAYYHWLRDTFRADVILHVGRHSTYEWLPGPSVGLSREDFPSLIVSDLPSVYLYIVDGVGEGLAAKRRGGAVIVDHLTPPLSATPLYDDLLALRQLVESHEALGTAPETRPSRTRAVSAIREKVEKLNMTDALRANMDAELKLRGLNFEEISDELLVHEVGHYLTELQERFMPYGLHVFGRPWRPAALSKMLSSLERSNDLGKGRTQIERDLQNSPAREMASLRAALEGRFVEPGHGNDPIRRPGVLPTGRNFHGLDGALLPTQVAYTLGSELAREARTKNRGTPGGAESVVLWASDTVRDEGVMVAFGMDMLGLAPVWNSRGILQSLSRRPLAAGEARRDVNFVTSGLFRDLYENLIVWLDRAVLLALDGASETIRREQPALVPALEAALAPLGEMRDPDDEPLAANLIAAHWTESTRELITSGMPAGEAGRAASLRLFGNAPGGYGAGVNNLVERSGAWEDRKELARAFGLRMGHAYGIGVRGAPSREVFEQSLARTEHTYLGRASRLYGLLDNNDSFDYVGGLRLAVEAKRGSAPVSSVVQYADVDHARVESVERALFSELRGRHLNPSYLKALVEHGYAGARSLSFGFVENLWGWQVTSPDLVKPWVWDEVHAVYLQDRHQLGMDKLWKTAGSSQVKANIEAVLLVAAQKGFWSPGEPTLRALAQDFAELVAAQGLPGSGHTRPDHPVMAFIRERVSGATRVAFERALTQARRPPADVANGPGSVSEVRPATPHGQPEEPASGALAGRVGRWFAASLLACCVGLFIGGIWRGRR